MRNRGKNKAVFYDLCCPLVATIFISRLDKYTVTFVPTCGRGVTVTRAVCLEGL